MGAAWSPLVRQAGGAGVGPWMGRFHGVEGPPWVGRLAVGALVMAVVAGGAAAGEYIAGKLLGEVATTLGGETKQLRLDPELDGIATLRGRDDARVCGRAELGAVCATWV